MKKKIKAVQMGLGPIGNKMTRVLTERSNIQIVGAIDSDPAKQGQDIGALAGLTSLGVKVTSDLNQTLGKGDVDIIVLTTTSSLIKIYNQLAELLPYGVNIVSSCEELCYPWLTNRPLANKIDELAKENQVSVLSTGINPGFLMDFLPIAMTGVSQNVNKITVERIQNATYRRIPFQQKIGAGLTVSEFHKKVEEGVLRHVGLTESMHMIASSMGWKLDRTEDKISPIIAEKQVKTGSMTIEPGGVLGVQQIGSGLTDGAEVVRLEFRAAIDEQNVRDRIIIEGTPTIESIIKDGVNGDVGTCAILANMIPAVVEAPAGLRTMVDIVPPHYHR